ncbi:MAG: aminotransferase class I/II-fold pyridoxal phosphate-dependent enzyme, partial [Nitrososphaera sp.]
VTSLLEEGDIAFVDRNSHASMLDGCKLAGGEARFFAHNSTEQLEKLLEEYKETHNKLIMCDGVYSMDGDLAPLPQICELGKRYGAGMAIDDGHATGVFGGTGRGTLQHFSLDGKGCLIIGSLAKALASVGGFVAGDHIVIDHLRHTARPLIFSTALSPIHTAIALEALKIIVREPHLREKLWSNAERMKQTLLALGFNIGNSVSPLIPIIVGDEATTYKMVLELEELGVVVDGVGYPGVKKNQCRLRIRMMATHSEQDIEIALKHLKRIGQKYKVV